MARKLVALGALGACARVRDGTVRSSKLFGSTVDQLYAKLEASTRPPPERAPRKKWPTFADCLRDAEDKIHQQAEKKLALVCTFVEIKFNALNRRVDLHAIDATPARWRGGAGSSPLDGASTAASSSST